MLLVMSASVQDDTLSLCPGTVAIAMTLRLVQSPPNLTQGVMLGVISGLGVLTKLTDWVLIVAIPAVLLYRTPHASPYPGSH